MTAVPRSAVRTLVLPRDSGRTTDTASAIAAPTGLATEDARPRPPGRARRPGVAGGSPRIAAGARDNGIRQASGV